MIKKLLGIVVLLIFVGSVLLFITSSNSGLLDIFKKTRDCDGTNYPNCYCVTSSTGSQLEKWKNRQECLKKGGKEKPLTKFEATQYCARKSEEFAKEVRKEVYKECIKEEGF